MRKRPGSRSAQEPDHRSARMLADRAARGPDQSVRALDQPAQGFDERPVGELEEDLDEVGRGAGRPRRGALLTIVASALAGAVVGGGLVFLSLWKPAPFDQRQPARSEPIDGGRAPVQATRGASGDWAAPLATAKQLAAAGKLREAQEEYLSILLIEPTHKDAMRGLVRVVGLLAKGNRAALLRQADTYRRAVALGIETEEHYTAPAMELLARASLQAAGQRVSALSPLPSAPETAQREVSRPSARSRPAQATAPEPAPSRRTGTARSAPEPRPAGERRQAAEPSETGARARAESPPAAAPRSAPAPRDEPPPRPAPRPAPQPSPRPTPGPTPPAQTAPPAPPPPAAVDINEPFVTVVVGPLTSSERASAITGELTIAGYAARMRRQAAGSYVITLGPYRQSEATRAAGYIRSRFGLPVSLTPAP